MDYLHIRFCGCAEDVVVDLKNIVAWQSICGCVDVVVVDLKDNGVGQETLWYSRKLCGWAQKGTFLCRRCCGYADVVVDLKNVGA